MIRYIFLDFDGTISDARRIVYKATKEVLEEFGCKVTNKKLNEVIGYRTDEIIKMLELDQKKAPEVRARLHRRLLDLANKNSIKLCASIEPLKELKKEGIKMIVLSNSPHKFLMKSVKILGVKGLFKKIYGSKSGKTKDKRLKKLFKKYNLKPKEVIYVGDRFSDIDYAHRAHCHAVAIYNKCAWSTKKEILAENPGFIISDFKDLVELVDKLKG